MLPSAERALPLGQAEVGTRRGGETYLLPPGLRLSPAAWTCPKGSGPVPGLGLEGLRPCVFPRRGSTRKHRPFPAAAPRSLTLPLPPTPPGLTAASHGGGGLARTPQRGQSCCRGQPQGTGHRCFHVDNMDQTRASADRPGLARGSSRGRPSTVRSRVWAVCTGPAQLPGILQLWKDLWWESCRQALSQGAGRSQSGPGHLGANPCVGPLAGRTLPLALAPVTQGGDPPPCRGADAPLWAALDAVRPPSGLLEPSSILGPDPTVLGAGFQRRQREPYGSFWALSLGRAFSTQRILGCEEAGTESQHWPGPDSTVHER